MCIKKNIYITSQKLNIIYQYLDLISAKLQVIFSIRYFKTTFCLRLVYNTAKEKMTSTTSRLIVKVYVVQGKTKRETIKFMKIAKKC